jgi:LysM repeat protein
MTKKQITMIIGINAVISALISVVVVLLLGGSGTPADVVAPTATLPVAAATAGLPAPAETGEPTQYVVQPGDTLSALAVRFGVDVEEIVAANNLVNPNFLAVGTRLTIPTGGLPDVTPTWTAYPTPTEAEPPFEAPSEQTATAQAAPARTDTPEPTSGTTAAPVGVEITDILDVGVLSSERAILTNTGQSPTGLQGFTLSAGEGLIYTFPNLRLWPGSSVTVHSRAGQDYTPGSDLYWNRLEPVWVSGSRATLRDATGVVVDVFIVP